VTELIDYGMTMAGMNADTGGGPGNLSLFRHPPAQHTAGCPLKRKAAGV